jgi:hypothetical protein
MSHEGLTDLERNLIEQARLANKLLSIFVLAIQEKALTENAHSQIVRDLKSAVDFVEREGSGAVNHSPHPSATLALPIGLPAAQITSSRQR